MVRRTPAKESLNAGSPLTELSTLTCPRDQGKNLNDVCPWFSEELRGTCTERHVELLNI